MVNCRFAMSSLTWLNQEIQLMAQQYAAELVSIKKIEMYYQNKCRFS